MGKEKVNENENPKPDEKVCFNCKNMLWMVGLGLGIKCRIDNKSLDSRFFSCEKFEKK